MCFFPPDDDGRADDDGRDFFRGRCSDGGGPVSIKSGLLRSIISGSLSISSTGGAGAVSLLADDSSSGEEEERVPDRIVPTIRPKRYGI